MTASPPAILSTALGWTVGHRTIVTDVDFTADAGEVVAVVGPNGAGKSSILRLLAGDIVPSQGSVELGGRNPHRVKPVDLALIRSYLGPRPLDASAFTVRDIVAMGRHPHRRSHATTAAQDEAIIHECMLATGVDTLADQVFLHLSSGESRRVEIARILAQETPVVLLDEPTSWLDIGHQALVMRALRDRASDGTAVVAVIHDLNLASRFADRLVLMSSGGVAADGAPGEVLDSDLLTEVYSYSISVVPNPLTGGPLVVPSR